jgi:hypothetical protein
MQEENQAIIRYLDCRIKVLLKITKNLEMFGAV